MPHSGSSWERETSIKEVGTTGAVHEQDGAANVEKSACLHTILIRSIQRNVLGRRMDPGGTIVAVSLIFRPAVLVIVRVLVVCNAITVVVQTVIQKFGGSRVR